MNKVLQNNLSQIAQFPRIFSDSSVIKNNMFNLK